MRVKDLIFELRKQDPHAIVEDGECHEIMRVCKMLSRRRIRTASGRRSDTIVHLETGEPL